MSCERTVSTMTATRRRYDKVEFARRGDDAYARVVLPRLQPADDGRFVALDIESGEFEIADDALSACDLLRTRLPDAQVWLVRVGSRTVNRVGAFSSEPTQRSRASSNRVKPACG